MTFPLLFGGALLLRPALSSSKNDKTWAMVPVFRCGRNLKSKTRGMFKPLLRHKNMNHKLTTLLLRALLTGYD